MISSVWFVNIMTSSFRFKNSYVNSYTNRTPRVSAAPVYSTWWPWTLSVNQGYHIDISSQDFFSVL
jgi:hypothetical protein